MHTPHPARWRETIDPFSLTYHNFQLKEVIGYPHAANDVFHVAGIYEGRKITAYLKVARQEGTGIEHEANILSQIKGGLFPKVIDSGREPRPFSVTAEMPGKRLSLIVGENEDMASLSYMEAYGEALAKFHRMSPPSPRQRERKFYQRPTAEMLEDLGLEDLEPFFEEKPKAGQTVFCHGDFHYANVLWQEHRLSAILDLEFAGYGDRDFDIAWALFLRPEQKFLKTDEERESFLRGYGRYGAYDEEAVKYYMAQNYVHFLSRIKTDREYGEYAYEWLKKHIS